MSNYATGTSYATGTNYATGASYATGVIVYCLRCLQVEVTIFGRVFNYAFGTTMCVINPIFVTINFLRFVVVSDVVVVVAVVVAVVVVIPIHVNLVLKVTSREPIVIYFLN